MEKNKLSSRIAGIGLVVLAFALTLNFVYASKNYGIAYNALSVYVLAQTGSSSGGSGSGSGSGDDTGTGGKGVGKVTIDSNAQEISITCDQRNHTRTVRKGTRTTCENEGTLKCENKFEEASSSTTITGTCPGSACQIR